MEEISRSEIVTIDECEQKAFKTYREDGHGWVPAGSGANITALQGNALHKGGERLFNEGVDSRWRDDVADALAGLPEPHRTIRTTLIRRSLLGWSIVRYPQVISEWKPLGAEIPFKWEFTPGIAQPLRMDDILEHRATQGLGIFDFKTAGSPDLNWATRKANSKQTHLYIKALKDVVPNRHVMGMMYECMLIGKWDNKKEIHKSPFVTGYMKNGKVTPKWVYGSETVDLCSYSDEKWLEWAHKNELLDLQKQELYWNTDLILPSDEDLMQTQEATGTQAIEWFVKLNRVKNSTDPEWEAKKLFPRNPDACLTFGWEHACPHYGRCWKGHQLDLETFEPRKNHHAVAIEE